jgi:Cu(I)/Ag(I) efflux system membrane fusion protein
LDRVTPESGAVARYCHKQSFFGWLVAIVMVSAMLAACGDQAEESIAAAEDGSAMEHAKKHLDPKYVCPMHPDIVRDQPASCPICGMDLVAKKIDLSEARPSVELSAAVVQNMGLRTATIERGTLWKYIKTQGKVTYDDDRIIQVHPRTAGWIENLYVRTDGVRVKRKDDLADYFSPDVLLAQRDYIDTLEAGELDSFGGIEDEPNSSQKFRQRAGVDLLRYFKVPNMDIMGIEQSMMPRSIVPIKAPQGGVITEHRVREGMFVTPASAMFTIVDLSEVWVMVDIFEHQIAWLRRGLTAEISTPAYPGRVWEGQVEFVYPEVDPQARTLRARLEFTNSDELLKPNMFVEAVIYGGPKREVLIVPREALILTGEREMVVKALGDNRFQPVEVETGMWQGDSVEVRSGLDEGDEIVLSGQFLIDSESNLQASFRRLAE